MEQRGGGGFISVSLVIFKVLTEEGSQSYVNLLYKSSLDFEKRKKTTKNLETKP